MGKAEEAAAMTSEMTILQLRRLRLGAVANEYARQMDDPKVRALSFDDRLGMMIDMECARRDNNRLAKLIKCAGFTDRDACVENISYSPDRELDPSLIQVLASCSFVERNMTVRLLGSTGAGKSYLANALGISACRKGYTVRYTNLQDMLIDLKVAKNAGTFNQVYTGYKKVKLLIVDDWLMFEIADDADASFLYNLIEARRFDGSMIICSQLDTEGWHERIANKVAADSICDRLAHGPYKILVKGEMRKTFAQHII
jgi:DNA replication protein DnaC